MNFRPIIRPAPAILRTGVGVFMLLAAGAKLFPAAGGPTGVSGLRVFAGIIAAHKVVPDHLSFAVAVATILVEILLGVWLLLHARERLASLATILLLAAFSIYLLVAYRRVGGAPCGCLGRITNSSLSSAIGRNIALAVALAATFLVRSPRSARA